MQKPDGISPTFCLRLPFLHPELVDRAEAGMLHLWSGQPAESCCDKFWQPTTFPLSEKAISRFLGELDVADFAELERLRQLLLNHPLPARSQAERQEMAELARFCSGNDAIEVPGEYDFILEKAQLFLLWTWLQEKKIIELAQLENECSRIDAKLLNSLWEDCEVWDLPPAVPSAPDISSLPDWRILVEQALFFVPQEIPILADGEMRTDLRELGGWRPLQEFVKNGNLLGGAWLGRFATFSEIAGKPQELDEISPMCQERLWLLPEEK